MSLVNELLDDVQQKQSASSMPLDIPPSADAPKSESLWLRHTLMVIFLIALLSLLFLQMPKWLAIWNKPTQATKRTEALTIPPAAQMQSLPAVDQAAKHKELSNQPVNKPIASIPEPAVSVRLQGQANTVTLWLQSHSPMDIGIVALMPNQQQLVIKKELSFDIEALPKPQAKWLKIETRYVAGQTLLWLKSPLDLSLKLDPVKQEMGWFNYLLHINVEQAELAQLGKKPVQNRQKSLKQREKIHQQNKNHRSTKPANSSSAEIPEKRLVIPSVVEADTVAEINLHQGIKARDQGLLAQARALQQQDALKQACDLVEQGLKKHQQTQADSDLIESRLWLLKQRLQQQNWQSFDKLLTAGMMLNPNKAALVKLAARAKLKQQDYNAAWNILAQLPVNIRADIEHVHLLASIAYRLKDYDAAYAYYQQLLRAEPENALNLVGLARTLEALQEPENALRAYELAFQQGLSKPRVKNFVIGRIQQLQKK